MADEDRAFLGAGPAFPFRLDAEGRFAMTSLEEHVRCSVLTILETDQGERVMRPEFGAGLKRLLFAPVTQATVALIEHRVRTALTRDEPRIEVVSVTVTPEGGAGRLVIEIGYRVHRTDTLFNLVHPFHLERGLP